jgi:predicted dinucleotide-binding enzyme
MRIGVIGAGRIGATIGALWLRAGHHVRFGARAPETLHERVGALGHHASAGTIDDAARFGEVVFTAAPYGAWPDLATILALEVAGKVVMDAANPYPARDGDFARHAVEAARGSGVPVAALLPGARLVRAFNSIFWEVLRDQANRAGERLAIPVAGDDHAALRTASALVRDAGFEPVVVGPLVQAAAFDVGEPAYNNPMTAAALERLLGLVPPG